MKFVRCTTLKHTGRTEAVVMVDSKRNHTKLKCYVFSARQARYFCIFILFLRSVFDEVPLTGALEELYSMIAIFPGNTCIYISYTYNLSKIVSNGKDKTSRLKKNNNIAGLE